MTALWAGKLRCASLAGGGSLSAPTERPIKVNSSRGISKESACVGIFGHTETKKNCPTCPKMRTATAVLGFAIAVASVNVGSRRSTPMGVRPRQLLEQENPGDSCVVRSLMFLQWLIWFPAYTFNTTSQGTFGDFGIGATDTVSGENFECYVKDIEFSPAEGEGWHDCNIPSTQFRFTIEPLAVEIRKNWTCDDAPG